MTKIAFEDLRPGTTLDLGTVTVDRDEMVAFARQYDPQPFHVDEDAGRESIFGGLSASGWFTACLWMRTWVTHFLNHSMSQGSPGGRELRWYAPVFPGDVLTCVAEIGSARTSRSRPGLGIVDIVGRCERDGETVMSFEFTAFFASRDQRAGDGTEGTDT